MFGERVRAARQAAGWTQAELAARAGVSRQLVAALEAGRHLPRVDAGVAVARALGVAVEHLLAPDPAVEAVHGAPPAPGTPVQVGRVGERLLCAPVPAAGESWAVADGVVETDGVTLLPGREPGAVAVGCDPALGLAGALAGERGRRIVTVCASTAAALAALAAGRAHAALVHGPGGDLPAAPPGVRRLRLAAWQVGLAAPAQVRRGWARAALGGRGRVVQRDAGAASQQAFLRAVDAAGGEPPAGPRATGHLDAARRAAAAGVVAVTIEPAALAAGLAFHPLETHTVELWIAGPHTADPRVGALVEVFASPALRRRLAAIGGYDLTVAGAVA